MDERDALASENARLKARLDTMPAFGSAGSMVVADGTATVFCDSAGMHELIRAHKHAAATGTAFPVVVPHVNVRACLIRTGLDAYLQIYPALAEALAAESDEEAATG